MIGVVSKAESVERPAAGCDEVLVFDAASLAAQVAELTAGRKVDVVYDPIGRATFEASLDSLRPRGLLVSFALPPACRQPSKSPPSTPRVRCSSPVPRSPPTPPTRRNTGYARRLCCAPMQTVSSSPGSGGATRWPAAVAHTDLLEGRSQGALVLLP